MRAGAWPTIERVLSVFEGVLHLLAGILQIRLGLVGLAFGLGVATSGDPAEASLVLPSMSSTAFLALSAALISFAPSIHIFIRSPVVSEVFVVRSAGRTRPTRP